MLFVLCCSCDVVSFVLLCRSCCCVVRDCVRAVLDFFLLFFVLFLVFNKLVVCVSGATWTQYCCGTLKVFVSSA